MGIQKCSHVFQNYTCSRPLNNPGELPLDLIPKYCSIDLHICPCYRPYCEVKHFSLDLISKDYARDFLVFPETILPLEYISMERPIISLKWPVYIFIYYTGDLTLGLITMEFNRISLKFNLNLVHVVSLELKYIQYHYHKY